MLGPDGWTMPVCISEPHPGGRIRFEWSDGNGAGSPPHLDAISTSTPAAGSCTSYMHPPDPTPENHVETTFDADPGGGTIRACA